MQKRVSVFLFLVVLLSTAVSAVSVSLSEVNSTFSQLTISNAVDMYAYEVNISIDSGTIGTVTSGNFLGSTSVATYGSNQKNGYLFVYGSRLDSSGTAVSGSGVLANITHTGDLTLKGLLAIDSDEDEEYESYNVASSNTSGDSSGTGSSSGTADILTGTGSSDLVIVPSSLSVNVVEGVINEEQITILNNGDESIALEITTSNLDEYVTFDDTTFTLTPGEERTINLRFLVDERGLITGKIILRSGGASVEEIPVAINVRSENFLFDAKISLNQRGNKVLVGNNMEIAVELLQVGPEEKVDVVANYLIKDFEGNELVQESETFFVLGRKTIIKEINTEGLPPGKYVLGLEIVYPGAFAVSSTQFEVVENNPVNFIANNIVFVAAGVVIVFLLVVVVWAVVRRPRNIYSSKKVHGKKHSKI